MYKDDLIIIIIKMIMKMMIKMKKNLLKYFIEVAQNVRFPAACDLNSIITYSLILHHFFIIKYTQN
jgi:hypothetical protein